MPAITTEQIIANARQTMRIVLLVISLGAFAVHSAVGVSDSQSSDDRNIQIVEEAKDDMFDEQAANDDFVV